MSRSNTRKAHDYDGSNNGSYFNDPPARLHAATSDLKTTDHPITPIYTNDAATIGQRLATEIPKTAAVDFRAPAQSVYTPAEIERHYAPIREALEPEDAAQFRWKGETGAVQTYQHTETGRNIHIDSKGQSYSQDGTPTSQEAALDRAIPAGRSHSKNELENSLGLGR